MVSIINFVGKHKKAFLVFLIAFVVLSGTFAGDAAQEMSTTMTNIVDFFGKGWVKAICCILLIGECLGLLFAGGQNPQIFKKFLPFIIGTVLFMCAGKIINIVFGKTDISFSSDINSK